MAPLLPAQAVFSLRHAPSWLLLAFAAGSVNAGAFLACQRFVTHVTGTVTRIGLDTEMASWWLVIDYAMVLASFIAGAFASTLFIDARRHQKKEALWAAPLALVSAILVAVSVAGSFGVFGEFGGSVEGTRDFVLLSILAFAMGLQNASVASTTGNAVRTTHMTGPASDFGVSLGAAFFAEGDARAVAVRAAAVRGGKIVAFITGAAVMVPLARAFHYGAFVMASVVILVATALSFQPRSSPIATQG
jgi:uncharacterized membrane protein YoaK (UPF0700 family)